MGNSTAPAPTKTTIRKVTDLNHGPVWLVRHGCGCGSNRFKTWRIALIFATRHCCPRPWPTERGQA